MDEDERFISVDQLPDDPLQMPPPYWRSGGAWFQLEDALVSLLGFLKELVPVHASVDKLLDAHYDIYSTEEQSQSEEAMDKFAEICDPLWEIEHKIKMKCDLAILMAAIQAEEVVNRFCVFNVPKELTESLEKLSPAEKLTAAASHLGEKQVRATAAFSAMTDLSAWRNAYAHGHCVDRPVKTLRHNHLISPNEYSGVPDSVAAVLKCVSGYLRIVQYLGRISVNLYTAEVSEEEPFATILRDITQFRFRGGPVVYEVVNSGGA